MKRPPYAKLMADLAAHPRNRSQSHWVLIGGDAWNLAETWRDRHHRLFTVCPPGEDPHQFDWSMYRNAPPPVGLVRCGAVDGDQLHRLAQCLFAAGSPRIYDVLGDAIYQRFKRPAA